MFQSYPDYYDVIKEPMDLKTVAQKIQRNEYTGIDDMVKDLHLMVANAKFFNEPGSEVYKVSRTRGSFGLSYLHKYETSTIRKKEIILRLFIKDS